MPQFSSIASATGADLVNGELGELVMQHEHLLLLSAQKLRHRVWVERSLRGIKGDGAKDLRLILIRNSTN